MRGRYANNEDCTLSLGLPTPLSPDGGRGGELAEFRGEGAALTSPKEMAGSSLAASPLAAQFLLKSLTEIVESVEIQDSTLDLASRYSCIAVLQFHYLSVSCNSCCAMGLPRGRILSVDG